jgi:hypothetical protein
MDEVSHGALRIADVSANVPSWLRRWRMYASGNEYRWELEEVDSRVARME